MKLSFRDLCSNDQHMKVLLPDGLVCWLRYLCTISTGRSETILAGRRSLHAGRTAREVAFYKAMAKLMRQGGTSKLTS